MRYLILLKAAQPASPPPPELMEAIMKLGGEATRSGALLDTAGLMPSAAGGAIVELSAGKLTVTDGPFAEAKEMISYAIYQVRDKAEAVEWATRFLNLHHELWPGWEGQAQVLRVFDPA
jgi:hypothetical protein